MAAVREQLGLMLFSLATFPRWSSQTVLLGQLHSKFGVQMLEWHTELSNVFACCAKWCRADAGEVHECTESTPFNSRQKTSTRIIVSVINMRIARGAQVAGPLR